jgi:galactose mutarotase-like enzyme
MNDQLTNKTLEIKVNRVGAELTSIKTVLDGLQFLWQGNPQYWVGQSYILFPIVGGLVDGKYEYKGKTYEMKSHGFARNSEFSLYAQTQNSLTYKLSYSEETLKQYPFKFDFFVSYTLEDNILKHGFKVKNLDDKEMLFSVGAHPGLNCPLLPEESIEDYSLFFEKPEIARSRVKADGLLTGGTVDFLNGQAEKKLTYSLFYNGPSVLKDLNSEWVELKSAKNDRKIKVSFKGFPDLGIWSAANDAPFVCIEPWFGVDSTKGDTLNFEEKEGLIKLVSGKVFECEYLIEIT